MNHIPIAAAVYPAVLFGDGRMKIGSPNFFYFLLVCNSALQFTKMSNKNI